MKRKSLLTFTALQHLLSSRVTRASARVLGAVAALFALSGCLITSPYWGQQFSDHTKAIPIQTWVTDARTKVKLECAQAFQGGLYPTEPSASWLFVTNITSQAKALFAPNGGKVFGAGKFMVLPADCWRKDTGNNIWYAALRATVDVPEDRVRFETVDLVGLECVGRENGKAASWTAWMNESTYCGTHKRYVIFRAPI